MSARRVLATGIVSIDDDCEMLPTRTSAQAHTERSSWIFECGHRAIIVVLLRRSFNATISASVSTGAAAAAYISRSTETLMNAVDQRTLNAWWVRTHFCGSGRRCSFCCQLGLAFAAFGAVSNHGRDTREFVERIFFGLCFSRNFFWVSQNAQDFLEPVMTLCRLDSTSGCLRRVTNPLKKLHSRCK